MAIMKVSLALVSTVNGITVSPRDAGLPITDAMAEDWNEHLKSINPSYRMFLKHYNHRWLPPTYRSDILFCDDSQSIGSIDGEVKGMYDDSRDSFLNLRHGRTISIRMKCYIRSATVRMRCGTTR